MRARLKRLTAAIRERSGLSIVIGIALVALFGRSGLPSVVRNYLELRRFRTDLKELKAEEVRLNDDLHKIKTNSRAIERSVRRELGYMKPGEIEYRFPAPK